MTLQLLLAHPKGMETHNLASQIGVNGPKGLAMSTRQIRAWGHAKFNLSDEQCVRTSERVVSISESLAAKIRGREKELLG
jgi:hypothetical protein